jgi:hypothetical protein
VNRFHWDDPKGLPREFTSAAAVAPVAPTLPPVLPPAAATPPAGDAAGAAAGVKADDAAPEQNDIPLTPLDD